MKLAHLSRVISLCLLSAGVLYAISEFKRGELPETRQIHSALMAAPLQSSVRLSPFDFEFMSNSYIVSPQAAYRICGLLVSHNNIHSVFDAYHSANSVDVRDLCVIWGGNLSELDFHRVKFWSETWSCHVRVDDQEVWEQFRMSELSNNHLLPATPAVQRQILQARVGDQVCFEGWLVDYAPAHSPELLRRTSLTRDDDGNGACEVVFVKKFSILRSSAPGWNKLADWSWNALLWLLPLKLITFLIFPVIEFKRT